MSWCGFLRRQFFVSMSSTVHLPFDYPGGSIKRCSGNAIMWFSEVVAYPFRPSNLVNNIILICAFSEGFVRNRVGPEDRNILRMNDWRICSSLCSAFQVSQPYKTDLIQALYSLILVFQEIWFVLHIFSRNKLRSVLINATLNFFCRPSIGCYNTRVHSSIVPSPIFNGWLLVVFRMTLVFYIFIA